jgi:serine/threonine-protein kinase RsbW
MADDVELTIPVQADLVVLARLTAATVASRADFDVEEIEDLRLAVNELCLSLVNGGGSGRLHLVFSRDEDLIEVSCSYYAGSPGVPTPSDGSSEGLSSRILDALVDEHGQADEDGQARAWLRKRRVRQTD